MAEAQPKFQPFKVFVWNLPLYITKSNIVFNKHGKSKRHMFMTFLDASSLENCLQAQPHTIGDVKVHVPKCQYISVQVGENFGVHVIVYVVFGNEITIKLLFTRSD